jgi:AcrR family transcriptional regulator
MHLVQTALMTRYTVVESMVEKTSQRASASIRKPRAAYHHGDLARALIQASLEIMAEVGAEGLSLREAARKAGVNHRAVYRHYEDKRALLAAIAEGGYRQLTAASLAALEEQVPGGLRGRRRARSALLVVAETFLRFARAEPARYQVMFGPRLNRDARFPELEQAIQGTVKLLVDELAEAAPQRSGIDRRDAGIAFLAAIHGLSSLVLAGRIRLRDAYLHDYVQKTMGPVVDGVLTGLTSD